MEKFLKALELSNSHVKESTGMGFEAKSRYKEIANKFKPYLGTKALYRSKSMKEYRLVTIEEISSSYIRVTYNYSSLDYEGAISTCINYPSLLSGDDVLEVEDIG